jgi:hypothetical protein
MPVPVQPASWVGSLVWLVALAAAAFAVSWLAANRLQMPRTPYIAVLTATTAVFLIGYVWWLDVTVADLVTSRWMWGLIVAPFSAAFLIIGMTKLPVSKRLHGFSQQLHGRRLTRALLWEGAVYGTAEGILLSVLPVFITWQMVHSLGWSGIAGGTARWALPMIASAIVIIVHHLGYWEYRNGLLVPITAGCGMLSLGYLGTASLIAPTLGHVLAHCTGLVRGVELPPHPRPATVTQTVNAATRPAEQPALKRG